MGLDVSHDCWHGAYSAFNRWRNGLAVAAGYEVAKIDSGDGFPHETALIDWGHMPDGSLFGEWPETPTDPLMILIGHSDCEGWIRARDCAALADRLDELVPLLPDENGGGHIGHWHDKTQRFIQGLRRAAAAGEDVEFY